MFDKALRPNPPEVDSAVSYLAENHASHIDALNARLDALEKRVCPICNDTGILEDSQAWDCGQPNSDCPYCPNVLKERLEALEKRVCPVRNESGDDPAFAALAALNRLAGRLDVLAGQVAIQGQQIERIIYHLDRSEPRESIHRWLRDGQSEPAAEPPAVPCDICAWVHLNPKDDPCCRCSHNDVASTESQWKAKAAEPPQAESHKWQASTLTPGDVHGFLDNMLGSTDPRQADPPAEDREALPDEDLRCPECNTPLGVLGVDEDIESGTWLTCHNEQCALCDYSFRAAGYELLPRRAAIRASVLAEVQQAWEEVRTIAGVSVLRSRFDAALDTLRRK